MKKLILLIAIALVLTACAKPLAVSSSSITIEPPTALNENEILALSPFNGTGLYATALHDGGLIMPYLTFIDGNTATQVPLCNTPSCQHNSFDCTAVFSTVGTFFSYNDKLIYCSDGVSSGYDSAINFGTPIGASSVIIADATGGNRKTINTIEGDFFVGTAVGAYKNNLIFVTTTPQGTMLNSMNMDTGENKQLFEQPLSGASYLGFYKNNIVFTDFEYIEDTLTTKVCLLNADDNSIKVLKEFEIPSKKSKDYNQSYYFQYYKSKIYQYTTDKLKGMDTISTIDCETGDAAVLCEDIKNESPWEQSIYAIVDDVMIIDSPQNDDDKNLPLFRRFTYNLNTGEKGEINLNYKEPTQGQIYPVNIACQIGNSLYVEQSKILVTKIMNNLEGIPTEIETTDIVYAIISKEDYLSSQADFKAIAK